MKEAIIQYNDNPDADGNHMVISWEPLVRCKDCKHGIGDENAFVCGLKQLTAGMDWFCADAERKDEE